MGCMVTFVNKDGQVFRRNLASSSPSEVVEATRGSSGHPVDGPPVKPALFLHFYPWQIEGYRGGAARAMYPMGRSNSHQIFWVVLAWSNGRAKGTPSVRRQGKLPVPGNVGRRGRVPRPTCCSGRLSFGRDDA